MQPIQENKGLKPTFDEFKKAVKKMFWEEWPTLTEEQVDTYLDGDEAMAQINNAYNIASRQFDSDSITRKIFLHGYVGSVANCLVLMFE